MKQKDLIQRFENNGWYFLRHGSNHDIYTNGYDIEKIPRHREVNERLAKDLIKKWSL
jgi:mRNA interferase HicA